MSVVQEIIEKRTRDLRVLLAGLEKRRDDILDQLASKRGEAAIIEEVIRAVYEQIRHASEEEVQSYQKEKRREEFKKASKGAKTPRKRKS